MDIPSIRSRVRERAAPSQAPSPPGPGPPPTSPVVRMPRRTRRPAQLLAAVGKCGGAGCTDSQVQFRPGTRACTHAHARAFTSSRTRSCMHACAALALHACVQRCTHARMHGDRASRIHLRSRESPAHSSVHSRQAAVAGPPEPRYAGIPLRRPPSGCAYGPLRPNGRHGRPIGPRPGVAPGPARLSGAAPGESPHVPWVMPARSNACSGATSS